MSKISIIASAASATMWTLGKRSSRRRRWCLASGALAPSLWLLGSDTALIQTQGYPGSSGEPAFIYVAKVELKPDQICGSTWDESEEHSCEKLLWHRLQQQCRRVPHWTRLQVVNKCFLWRGCVLNIHSISDLSTSTLPRGTSSGRDASRSLSAGYVLSCDLQFGYFHHCRSTRLVTILQIWITSSL